VQRGLMTLALISCLLIAHFGIVDQLGRSYTEDGFQRALITFGVARGLNGVISVAQGTELALQPAGIGINLAPGQILDPVNDLVERFSWVMLTCGTSLGVQRILLDITAWPGFTLLILACICASLFVLWRPHALSDNNRRRLQKVTLIVIIIRFAVPMAAVTSEAMYQYFLSPQYETAKQQLEQTTSEIGAINRHTRTQLEPESNHSLLDEARRLYQSASYQFDIDGRIEEYKQAARHLSEYTINLIVVFVLQTMAFPLFFLWLVVRIIRRIGNS